MAWIAPRSLFPTWSRKFCQLLVLQWAHQAFRVASAAPIVEEVLRWGEYYNNTDVATVAEFYEAMGDPRSNLVTLVRSVLIRSMPSEPVYVPVQKTLTSRQLADQPCGETPILMMPGAQPEELSVAAGLVEFVPPEGEVDAEFGRMRNASQVLVMAPTVDKLISRDFTVLLQLKMKVTSGFSFWARLIGFDYSSLDFTYVFHNTHIVSDCASFGVGEPLLLAALEPNIATYRPSSDLPTLSVTNDVDDLILQNAKVQLASTHTQYNSSLAASSMIYSCRPTPPMYEEWYFSPHGLSQVCYHPEDAEQRYVGKVNESKSGRGCLQWSQLHPGDFYAPAHFPSYHLESNYCRQTRMPLTPNSLWWKKPAKQRVFGPGPQHVPWCYVAGSPARGIKGRAVGGEEIWIEWEDCLVPQCNTTVGQWAELGCSAPPPPISAPVASPTNSEAGSRDSLITGTTGEPPPGGGDSTSRGEGGQVLSETYMIMGIGILLAIVVALAVGIWRCRRAQKKEHVDRIKQATTVARDVSPYITDFDPLTSFRQTTFDDQRPEGDQAFPIRSTHSLGSLGEGTFPRSIGLGGSAGGGPLGASSQSVFQTPKAWQEGMEEGAADSAGASSERALSSSGTSEHPGVLAEEEVGEVLLEGVIGYGSFGVVYKGSWNGVQVAAKVVEMVASRAAHKRMLNEMTISTKLRHPNIIQTYEASCRVIKQTTVHFSNGPVDLLHMCTLFLLEFGHGDLWDAVERGLLHHPSGAPNVRRILRVLLDTANGMAYMHQRKYIHCDLKLRNVFYSWQKVPDYPSVQGGPTPIQSGAPGGLVSPGGRPRDAAVRDGALEEARLRDVDVQDLESRAGSDASRQSTIGSNQAASSNGSNRASSSSERSYARSEGSFMQRTDSANEGALVEMVAKIGDFSLTRLTRSSADGASDREGFGPSKGRPGDGPRSASKVVGTASHVPPEGLTSQQTSFAGDVWAFGVIMWEVLMRARAHAEVKSLEELVDIVCVRQQRLQFAPLPGLLPGGLPAPDGPGELEQYAELAQRCWSPAPADRPTFPQIVIALREMLRT